jgi:hypothetical protein
MRERMGRGEMGQDGSQGSARATRDFQRAARGESLGEGSPNGGGQGQGHAENSGGQEGSGQTGKDGKPGAGSGARPGEGEGQGDDGKPLRPVRTETEVSSGAESMAGGDGAGHEAGGPPLGKPEAGAGRAQDREAQVADGAGPNRARVIGAAADRGFASPGYSRVYQDYQGAVEEALGASAVPEGKRYIVRRYFDLIRPRGGHR